MRVTIEWGHPDAGQNYVERIRLCPAYRDYVKDPREVVLEADGGDLGMIRNGGRGWVCVLYPDGNCPHTEPRNGECAACKLTCAVPVFALDGTPVDGEAAEVCTPQEAAAQAEAAIREVVDEWIIDLVEAAEE